MAPCKNYSCVLIGCCSYFDFVLQQAVEMPLSCEISTEKFIRGYQHIFSFHYYAILPHGSIRTRANMSLYYTVEQGKIATESWAHVSHKKTPMVSVVLFSSFAKFRSMLSKTEGCISN